MLTAVKAARNQRRLSGLIICFIVYALLSLSLHALASDHIAMDNRLLARWQQLIGSSHPLSDQQKLRRINRFFNQQISFVSDIEVWQQVDYWATPRETLLRAAGDCEDFSIAKYMTLLQSGVPAKQLRLIYVKAVSGLPESALQQAHMVLAYYPENSAEPLILDNLITEIQPASRRPDLIPLFSFNSEGLWVEGDKTTRSPEAHLSRWRSVLQRMQQEKMYLPR